MDRLLLGASGTVSVPLRSPVASLSDLPSTHTTTPFMLPSRPLHRPATGTAHPPCLEDEGPRLARAEWALNNGHAFFRGVDRDVTWTGDQSATPHSPSRDAMPPLSAPLRVFL